MIKVYMANLLKIPKSGKKKSGGKKERDWRIGILVAARMQSRERGSTGL